MLSVREASQSDIDTVYALIIAIAKHHDQQQYVITDKAELLRAGFGDKPEFGVLLAEINGEVAGYCSYTWNYSIWLGARYMNIDDVFVWEDFRGQKVGEALMLKAKEVGLSRGASRIRWEVEQDNHGAIKFYRRLGANVDIKGVCRWQLA
ncbi:GNAT family N-acetyltransferase [Thalassomonas sp. RHCl1]|uniref:GNAT family N-acetyltransferase n=1 Tax=Thalassomonas sp. RHCl1 TaxID=2995320 RepID=UPI00248D0692|nr:GNAT family N-acetyltransferase [Thalassomonas sp. RHCl1]